MINIVVSPSVSLELPPQLPRDLSYLVRHTQFNRRKLGIQRAANRYINHTSSSSRYQSLYATKMVSSSFEIRNRSGVSRTDVSDTHTKQSTKSIHLRVSSTSLKGKQTISILHGPWLNSIQRYLRSLLVLSCAITLEALFSHNGRRHPQARYKTVLGGYGVCRTQWIENRVVFVRTCLPARSLVLGRRKLKMCLQNELACIHRLFQADARLDRYN